jgi:hypothetical protein
MAEYGNTQREWLLNIVEIPRLLAPEEEAICAINFDMEFDKDISNAEFSIKQKKFLKRAALVNLLLFPLEYTLLTIFFEKRHRTPKKLAVKLYYKFLRNKLTLYQFKTDLRKVLKGSSII